MNYEEEDIYMELECDDTDSLYDAIVHHWDEYDTLCGARLESVSVYDAMTFHCDFRRNRKRRKS